MTKYIPIWKITYKGETYNPARPEETQRTLPADFPEDEIKRLTKLGAVKKLSFDDGENTLKPTDDNNDNKPLDQMSFSELKLVAKERGITVPVGTSTEGLRAMLADSTDTPPGDN